MPADVEDGANPYCSGCCVPEPLPPGATLTDAIKSPFPYGRKVCPVCGDKKRFKYTNEWTWKCGHCGSDALDT